jgi:hypothetical protein
VLQAVELVYLLDRISGLESPEGRRALGRKEAKIMAESFRHDLGDLLTEVLPEAAARDREGFPDRLWRGSVQ